MLDKGVSYDDIHVLNTQSGSQWDGLRHFSHIPTAQFYNGVTHEDILGACPNHRGSVHHWADHGIAGRGILLDYYTYAQSKGIVYDPFTHHAITYDELHACGIAQGLDIRPVSQGGDIKVGDILLIRSGWVSTYNSRSPEDRATAALRPDGPRHASQQRWAGVAQEDKILDWLHDSYFAAVAGDAPAFEAWPPPEGTEPYYYLHEYILARWGMPLGELFDLERLAKMCAEKKRWTFFFSSSPAHVKGKKSALAEALNNFLFTVTLPGADEYIGGVSSHSNAQAVF